MRRLGVRRRMTGAELLLHGRADVVFNLLGGFHHAFPERAAGFCYLNDVALACLKLADAGKRVLYLDVTRITATACRRRFMTART